MRAALILVLLAATAACRDAAPPAADAVPMPATATPSPPDVSADASAVRAAAPIPDLSATAPPEADAMADPAAHADAQAAASARCLARTGQTVSREAQAIHRWVDAAGIVHYSDRAPDGAVREHRRVALSGVAPVSVEATGYDVNLPADVHARAVADAVAIDRVLRQLFAAGEDDRLALRLVFVASPQVYADLIGEPALAQSAGAYSARDRTVYVRIQSDAAATFRVLRHEIVHALIHERVGNLPTTLNEGLAGYFERFEAAGQGGRVELSGLHAHPDTAAPPDPAVALTELLALDGPDFYRTRPGTHYTQALALVAVLMRAPAGRVALGELLAQQRTQPCEPIAIERVLDPAYPGGLAALAEDLAGWMRATGDRSQQW